MVKYICVVCHKVYDDKNLMSVKCCNKVLRHKLNSSRGKFIKNGNL